MKKLFGLFLLALAFLAPVNVEAASCFWVGGTATWDGTNTGGGGAGGIKWASASGGGTACGGGGTGGSPAAADTATFDANSGGGTVTPSVTINVTSISAGAFTSGTLAFNTNNNDVNAQTVSFTGTVTRTINMGSGTWTITGTTGNVFDAGTQTNLTPTFSNAALVFSGNGVTRLFQNGSPAGGYGNITVNNNSSPGVFGIQNAATFASITVGSGVTLVGPASGTITVTGALSITGTSSAPSGLSVSNSTTGSVTFSVGSASTIAWAGILGVTRSGAGTLTATNSLDMGKNSSFTSITAPSGGGSGGGRIIGG